MSASMNSSLGGRMSEMVDMIQKISKESGFKGLVGEGGAIAKVTDGADGADAGDVDMESLTKTLQETKGKMVHMEKLLEESANEPIITETLLGE